MATSKFVPSVTGIAALGRTTQMAALLKARAEVAASAARSVAPVRTGHYKDSIETSTGVSRGTAAAYVLSKDFKALWIEFGTEDTPAHAPLRRGCDAAGLEIRNTEVGTTDE